MNFDLIVRMLWKYIVFFMFTHRPVPRVTSQHYIHPSFFMLTIFRKIANFRPPKVHEDQIFDL